MSKIIRPKKGRWLYGVFKGLELSGIGKANGWRIVCLIACCFGFGIPALIYFALAIILPHEKNKIYQFPLNIFCCEECCEQK